MNFKAEEILTPVTVLTDSVLFSACIQLCLNFVHLQFDPELVIVSSGYDAAIGDAEVTFALIVII